MLWKWEIESSQKYRWRPSSGKLNEVKLMEYLSHLGVVVVHKASDHVDHVVFQFFDDILRFGSQVDDLVAVEDFPVVVGVNIHLERGKRNRKKSGWRALDPSPSQFAYIPVGVAVVFVHLF